MLPIISAIRANNIDRVRMMIDDGAVFDDHMVLTNTASMGRVDIMRLFIDRGVDINRSELNLFYLVIARGNWKMLRMLIGAGLNVEDKKDLGLSEAVRHGHIKVVKLLLDVGCNVNCHSCSPIKWAIHNRHEDMVRLLLRRGSMIDESVTIMDAVVHGPLSMVRLLLAYGMDPNHCFYEVIVQGDADRIRLFLKHGASPKNIWLRPIGNDVKKIEQIVKIIVEYGHFHERLDVYKYVGIIDERHHSYLPAILQRAVLWRGGMRKRLMAYPSDVMCLCSE